MKLDSIDLTLDFVLHDNYGLSTPSSTTEETKSHGRKISSIPGLVALAFAQGIDVLNESGSSSYDQIHLTAGASSTLRVFNLRPHYGRSITSTKNNEYRAVVSKHLSKAITEDETRRYDAVARELLILSHPPIAQHKYPLIL